MHSPSLFGLTRPLLPVALAAVAALATFAALPSPAAAQQPASAAVATHDLDLGSAQGKRALEARLDRAAHAVCRPTSISITTARHEQDSCVVAALAAARPQVDRIAAARAGTRTVNAFAVASAAR